MALHPLRLLCTYTSDSHVTADTFVWTGVVSRDTSTSEFSAKQIPEPSGYEETDGPGVFADGEKKQLMKLFTCCFI